MGNGALATGPKLPRPSSTLPQEACLSRSLAWPVLKDQQTNDRGSTSHRIQAAGDPKRPLAKLSPGFYCVGDGPANQEIRVITLKDADPAWELVIEGATHRLATGDRAQFCALLGRVQDEEMTHVQIRRWEGDALSVHLNRDRGFPMYLRQWNDYGCIFPVWDAEPRWTQEQFGCRCCEPWEIARHATLPRQIALCLLIDFFERGVHYSGEWGP